MSETKSDSCKTNKYVRLMLRATNVIVVVVVAFFLSVRVDQIWASYRITKYNYKINFIYIVFWKLRRHIRHVHAC